MESKEEGEIEKLQAQIKDLEKFAQEGWDLAEAYMLKIEELEQKRKMLCNNGVHY